MKIIVAALEHCSVPIEIREVFSFTASAVKRLNKVIAGYEGIEGCVLLSTCNRTEIYLSVSRDLDPAGILCKTTELSYDRFKDTFTVYDGNKAVHHLIEVTAGIRSRVFGEDQIISQVRTAIALAREAKSTDPLLETLFRIAVTCGKEIRTSVRLTPLSASAAENAVRLIEGKAGEISGKKALIIGNGEMGRLAASILTVRGCDVTITLRTYRHGETIVPAGCKVIPYEERYEHMGNLFLLVSATTSPHYTVTFERMKSIKNPPEYIVDLSVPRDVQPEVGGITRVYNVDELGEEHISEIPKQVYEIMARHEQAFSRWLKYKDSLPSAMVLKESLVKRIITDRDLSEEMEISEIVSLTVDRAVDLILGGLEEGLDSEEIKSCSEKIKSFTTAKPTVTYTQAKKVNR